MANHFSFHKGNVEAGGVIVDELKEEHLQSQAVLVVSHSPGKLCCPIRDGKFLGLSRARTQAANEEKHKRTIVCDPDGDALVEHIKDHDDNKADDGGCDRRGHLRRHVLLYWLQVLQFLGISEFN